MLNIFSGIRRDTVVGLLQVLCVTFLVLSALIPLFIVFAPRAENDKVSLEAMILVGGIFLFCLLGSGILFGLSFVVEDTAALAQAASQSEAETSSEPKFENRVRELEAREGAQAPEPSSNGEDDEKFMISVPRPAPATEGAPASRPAPAAEAGKCFDSVKTYVDLDMWPLAYQKAQELLQKFPDSPQAATVRKSLEHFRLKAEETEASGMRR